MVRVNRVSGEASHFRRSVSSKYYMLMMMTAKPSTRTYLSIFLSLPFTLFYPRLLTWTGEISRNLPTRGQNKSTFKKNCIMSVQKDLTIFAENYLWAVDCFVVVEIKYKMYIESWIEANSSNWGKNILWVIATEDKQKALLLRF